MNFILWLVVSSTAGAAEGLDAKALQAALKKYQGIEKLDVGFVQVKYFKDMKINLTSKGHLTVLPPDKVVWEVKEPAVMKITMDSSSIWIQSAGTTSKYTTSDIPEAQRKEFLSLAHWLKLDAEAIHERYEVRQLKEHLEFQAREAGSLFNTSELSLNKDGHVDRLVFKEKSGDEMHLKFSKPTIKYAIKK